MYLDKSKLNNLIDEVTLFNEIQLYDIPCVDLYMDQITTFFDDKLGHLKRDEDDVILTKTMINNYTKGKILMHPKKKKYSKEHIVLLILLYNLKQTLSINDIKSLFTPLIKDISNPEEKNFSIDEIYSSFLEIKEIELEDFNKRFKEKLDVIKEKTEDTNYQDKELIELILIVLTLINQANTQKRLAEKIIDSFFV